MNDTASAAMISRNTHPTLKKLNHFNYTEACYRVLVVGICEEVLVSDSERLQGIYDSPVKVNLQAGAYRQSTEISGLAILLRIVTRLE